VLEKNFRGNGKLLITGEYFVLDGAKALALPTILGQSLNVKTIEDSNFFTWKSYDNLRQLWFEGSFDIEKMEVLKTTDNAVSSTLLQMFQAIKSLKNDFFLKKNGLEVSTHLEFPRDWGLGSSSTLVYCLAEWAEIDPYVLLEKTMGGSGYDIACAGAKQAIIFERKSGESLYENVDFKPDFSQNLYFIYLGKKQNSREGIARYREKSKSKSTDIQEVTNLTNDILNCKNLIDFEKILEEHESLVSRYLDLPTAKSLFFQDYFGTIKSLGAWGGDFVLATSNRSEKETFSYFLQKGFETIVPYDKMIL
jgi:mevalonate kinase